MNLKHVFSIGFIIWLVPFIISFFFYNRESELLVPYLLFKTIMFVSLIAICFICFNWYYNKIGTTTRKLGIMAGAVVLIINWLLDFTILLPLAQMTILDYFMEIGLSYLIIIPFVNWIIGRKHLKQN